MMRSRSLAHVVIASLGVSVVITAGCGPFPPGPSPVPGIPPTPTVTVEFGGRVVNAETGGPVANVTISVRDVGFNERDPAGWADPKDTATSGGDGTFTLPLNLPSNWGSVTLRLTAPRYDDAFQFYLPVGPKTATDRPAAGMDPTLVIRPGESIEVRVNPNVKVCDFFGNVSDSRRVLIEASPGAPVELEIVPHDPSKPMGLVEDICNSDDSDEPVFRSMVAGGVAYVYNAGTATLTARR